MTKYCQQFSIRITRRVLQTVSKQFQIETLNYTKETSQQWIYMWANMDNNI